MQCSAQYTAPSATDTELTFDCNLNILLSVWLGVCAYITGPIERENRRDACVMYERHTKESPVSKSKEVNEFVWLSVWLQTSSDEMYGNELMRDSRWALARIDSLLSTHTVQGN